ncbi:hypothetical protein I4U23_022107 [Adineta vaga]|nr:hypothetical protein I4U23_022107 [Adineta vaga]
MSGVVEIVWPFLFIIVFFCCKEEDFQTTVITYQHWVKHPGWSWQKNGTTQEKRRGIGTLTLYAALICLFASFILWCCGNAWIAVKYKYVQYYNINSTDYCHPQLFKELEDFSMNSVNEITEGLSRRDHPDLIDVDADAAFAFELQAQEYAKYNNSSSRRHHYSSTKQVSKTNNTSLPSFADEDQEKMVSDGILAARLQQEEDRKRHDPATANDALLAARLQEEENRKNPQNQQLSHRTYQSDHSSTAPFAQSRSFNPPISNSFRSLTSEFPNNFDFHRSRNFNNRIIDNTEDLDVDDSPSSYESEALTRSKALTNDQINILPTEKFRRTANKSDEQNKCGVCWDEFQQNETLRRLTCLHIYHKDCIDPWLQKKNQCPICREPPINFPNIEILYFYGKLEGSYSNYAASDIFRNDFLKNNQIQFPFVTTVCLNIELERSF